MRPVLTIAVPTYNRADSLKKGLLNTLKYFDPDKMELIISDNASSDETEEVVGQLIKQYRFIQYYRQAVNVGFDGNFLNCFNKANGQYLLIFSDDDFLLPGSLESILNGIKKEPVFMHLNSSRLINYEYFNTSSPRFNDEGLRIYKDKNEFMQKVGINITFLSSLVFNVDAVRNINQKEKYVNTFILQSHIAFETMKLDGNFIINTHNCVAATGNKTVGYDVYNVWIYQLKKLFLRTAIDCGFDKGVMDEMYRNALNTTVYSFVLQFRYTCADSNKWDKKCLWNSILEYKDLRIKYKIVTKCPRFLLPFLKKGISVIRKMKYLKNSILRIEKQ